jgi:hyperosmotically inducible protein
MRRFAVLFALTAFLFASPLISQKEGLCVGAQQAAPHVRTISAQSTPNQQKSDDRYSFALSREIHHQILVLPFYSVFDSINFTVEGGKVTLTGRVVRRTLKEHAEAAVRSIEGVTVVVNQIEVLPTSPSDDDLRDAIYRVIYEDPTLARYAIQKIPPIHIIVDNGNVALEGSVDSASDKHLAATRASSVANVRSVKNNLMVHPKESAAK